MRLFVTFLFLCYSLASFNQVQKKWLGHYSGDLVIENISGSLQVYHMELIFQELSDTSFQWTIIYGEDSLRQERNYVLLKIADNRFEIDEANSIILSCNLIGNQFISVFEVENNLIHVVYPFSRNKVIFDLTSSTSQYQTGQTEPSDSSEIPLVISFQTTTLQKAILKRQKRTI